MKWNLSKLAVCIVLLSAIFLGINTTTVSAQTDLVVEGNVLGYELYVIRPFSNMAFPVLLKVTKVVKGVEKSEYIEVLLFNLYKEYADENFGLNKITTFKVQRITDCDIKIKNFFYAGETIENGEIVKTPQTFTLVPGVEKNSLPLKKKIPCYLQSIDE